MSAVQFGDRFRWNFIWKEFAPGVVIGKKRGHCLEGGCNGK